MSATPRKTRTAAKSSPLARRPGVREQAAQTTRDNILKAAIKVFARYGYDGGSLEKISKAAKSFDRMIYYYFGSKEGLYIEVIEEIYRRMNEAEAKLDLDPDQPVDALQAVIRFVVGYYRRNPEFVTLLNTENLHKGKHIVKSVRAREYSSPAIEVIRQLLASGQAQGLFRPDMAARDLYLLIAANGYFYMSNRHTLSAFLGEDLEAPEALAHWEEFVIDTVLRAVAPHPPLAAPAPARSRASTRPPAASA
ncbi:TetR family transcriptional regulator [Curvibacter sp. RS43]|uniref:TetR family transcriptional regulator n=1 Tax=Curvibacter microcysteis TaxID=3026419 RepID=UPI00236039F2|nr:TetR family transcriptional regulator [Curvibacter sp. RS43]MDD0811162.1 TetR family transcriptional regulator [Curvibacter sp. RS43]